MLKAYDAWFSNSFDTDVGAIKYSVFERDCKSDLEKMATENGLELYGFYKNYFYFEAVLTDGEKFVYVSIKNVWKFGWKSDTEVLVRIMKHANDLSGGGEIHYCKWDKVGEVARKLMGRDYAK